MGVWSRLFGDKSEAAKSEAATPLLPPSPGAPTVTLALDGKLTVAFHAHDSVEGTAGNFLTAVTQGLQRLGQRELVFTLRLGDRDDAAALMPDIRRFFTTVFAWARQRQIVDAGGVSQFGENALFGRSGSGVVYADARPFAGVELPARALCVILVDAAEARVALDFGAYRVLTRMGEHYRHFPFPTWSDLLRPTVASERDKETLLAKMARTRASGVSFLVEHERDRVRIQLRPGVRETLGRGVASLPPGAPFALLTKPAADANAVLVWHPGQTEPGGISPDGVDGSLMSGSCLMVAPGGQSDECRIVEDGYSLLFSDESWASVSAALGSARPISVRMAQGTRLELEWLTDEPAL
jgi:hypothetical protein